MKVKRYFFVLWMVSLPLARGFAQDTPTWFRPGMAPADTNVVLPPAWAFGMLYGAYTNQEQTVGLIKDILAHDYPIDAFWIDSWIWDWKNQGEGPKKYLDFVADTASYPDMQGMWDFMKRNNIKSGMWVWDCIFQAGNERVYEEFKSKGLFSNEYVETNSWHNGSRTTIIGDGSKPAKGTWCGNIDFHNPKAAALFKEKMKPFFDKGLDFIKLDRTDAIHVCRTMFEMTQELGLETEGRGFIFSHSEGRESEEYKRYPGKWTDDTRSDWSSATHTRTFSPWLPYVGFKENIAKYTDLSKGTHQIPFLANDMGGFAVSEDGYVDEELFIRWLQFACFVPLTTPFAQPENPTRNIPFLVSDRADQVFRAYSHLKMRLFPYLYTYAQRSRLEGVTPIRPIPGYLYQYLLGEELLVAPVYGQGQTTRTVFLPGGAHWMDYWTGKVYAGEATIQVEAPVERMPVFVRQGAIIPMRKYARSIETGTNDVLELHVYPGANGQFVLVEDDGRSNDYLNGVYAATQIAQQLAPKGFSLRTEAVYGQYKGMEPKRRWEVVIHAHTTPKAVFLDGKRASFSMQDGLLLVKPFSRTKRKSWTLSVQFE